MKRFKSKTNLTVLLVVLAVGASLMVGCSGNPVGEITNEPTVLQRSLPAGGPQYGSMNTYAEAVISSANGGELFLVDVNLSIPAGAVPNDTLYSINIPDLSVFYNEFGTDGLVFDKPVTVTMSYRDADMTGVTESTIRLAWYNEKSGRWLKIICEVDTQNKTVTGQLNHFSAYGLISD